MATNAEKMT